ncbi:carbohydrate ABC transporter permease [Armatimonas rosea]|uniref:Multiple sugar transport system permease protein n=1 Tax=Armatimonas rosea TaxID=685828 RepID=A0A7W9W521_ARMRO|nr:sugar ABC transporter permease [Armatimonas rosea]MBB6049954.1 multiple sugar transport system permease protein [Armatimonas rosea]
MSERTSSRWGLALISPWLLGFLIFTAGPMLASLYLSFCKYDLHSLQFVGTKNYEVLLTRDPLFWKSLGNTALYVLFSVPLGLTGSLLIAVLLNQKVKGIPVFRTLFYLPSLVPAVASALVWQWVFHPDAGILNFALSKVGVHGPKWLQDPKTALMSLIIMSLWGIGGSRMLIFLAGLQGVSDELYEAAQLDGADGLTCFRHITLPMLSPTIFFNLILGIIGSFQVFTSAYIMTGGGPDNATLMYVLYLYNNAFRFFKLGKASAMAWILFIMLLGFTGIQFKNASKWVYYEGGEKE